MYQARKARDMSRIIPIEHMISAIAYRVADYVNENTKFGEAASTILNNSALVQMYTDTRDSADAITVTKLTAVYPSQTVTGVLLDASKAYMSTQGKGNFTFEILKNGAKPADVNPIDGVDSLETGSASDKPLADYVAPRSNVRAGGDTEKLGTEKALGRKRQR
jgi:purine nucleoside permease